MVIGQIETPCRLLNGLEVLDPRPMENNCLELSPSPCLRDGLSHVPCWDPTPATFLNHRSRPDAPRPASMQERRSTIIQKLGNHRNSKPQCQTATPTAVTADTEPPGCTEAIAVLISCRVVQVRLAGRHCLGIFDPIHTADLGKRVSGNLRLGESSSPKSILEKAIKNVEQSVFF